MATPLVGVATTLLTGVMVGVGLSVFKLIYTFSRLRLRTAAVNFEVRWRKHEAGTARVGRKLITPSESITLSSVAAAPSGKYANRMFL